MGRIQGCSQDSVEDELRRLNDNGGDHATWRLRWRHGRQVDEKKDEATRARAKEARVRFIDQYQALLLALQSWRQCIIEGRVPRNHDHEKCCLTHSIMNFMGIEWSMTRYIDNFTWYVGLSQQYPKRSKTCVSIQKYIAMLSAQHKGNTKKTLDLEVLHFQSQATTRGALDISDSDRDFEGHGNDALGLWILLLMKSIKSSLGTWETSECSTKQVPGCLWY